jgi:hypothetical protein
MFSVVPQLPPLQRTNLNSKHIENIRSSVLCVLLCFYIIWTGGTFEGHIEASKLVHPLALAYVTARQVPLTVEMLQLMSFRAVQVSDWVGEFILAVLMLRKIRIEPEQLCELLKVKLVISFFDVNISRAYSKLFGAIAY